MPDYILHGKLGYRVSRLAQVLQSRLEKLLAPFGLTRLSWCALTGIGDEGISTPSELADYIGITRPASSRVLREMEARGYVAREGTDSDGRTVILSLTPLGQSVLRQVTPEVASLGRHFASKVSPEAMRTFLDTARLLAEGEGDPLTRL